MSKVTSCETKWPSFSDLPSSKLARLLDTASKFALFSVSGLNDEKLIKKQTYMKTETCEVYLESFEPNFVKIDLHNFELNRFKVKDTV